MLTEGLEITLRLFDLKLAAVLAATEKFDTLLALLLLRSMIMQEAMPKAAGNPQFLALSETPLCLDMFKI